MKPAENVSQILCCHCEELVHRYASHCPYCQKPVSTKEQAVSSSPKTKLIPSKEHENVAEDQTASIFGKIETLYPEEGAASRKPPKVESEKTFGQETLHSVVSLFSLLAGSFFFFFGLLILLFSDSGRFSLEWQQADWPYFVFSSIALVLTGLWSLSKLEK